MTGRLSRLWFVAFVVSLFLAGVASGVLITTSFERSAAASSALMGQPRRPGGRPPRLFADRLARELNLSPEQTEQLRAIFAERRARLEKFHADVRSRFEHEQHDLRAAVAQILTTEQRERFEQVMRRGSGGRVNRRFRNSEPRSGPS